MKLSQQYVQLQLVLNVMRDGADRGAQKKGTDRSSQTYCIRVISESTSSKLTLSVHNLHQQCEETPTFDTPTLLSEQNSKGELTPQSGIVTTILAFQYKRD